MKKRLPTGGEANEAIDKYENAMSRTYRVDPSVNHRSNES
jgi:hypothetical protein